MVSVGMASSVSRRRWVLTLDITILPEGLILSLGYFRHTIQF